MRKPLKFVRKFFYCVYTQIERYFERSLIIDTDFLCLEAPSEIQCRLFSPFTPMTWSKELWVISANSQKHSEILISLNKPKLDTTLGKISQVVWDMLYLPVSYIQRTLVKFYEEHFFQ